METFSTYARYIQYELPIYLFEDHSFDNAKALGNRFSIVIIEKGSGSLKINGQSFFYNAPCVLCINETEHIIIDKNEEQDLKIIYFHPGMVNCLLDFTTIRKLPEDCSITLNQDSYWGKLFLCRDTNYFGKITVGPLTIKRISQLFNRILSGVTLQNQVDWPCRGRSFFLEILFTLDNVFIEEVSFEEPLLCQVSEEFEPILIYIYNNYDSKLAVDNISKKFNLNRTTLAKMFQDNINESFITFLNKLRVSIGAQLLRDTLLPVSEIMYRTGFNDASHFLRTFKRYTNLSPSDYRDKFCWMQ